ncbi:MAG: hypothetical protein ACKVTZ_13530, partial [Bacteroidia bacterium]
LFFIPVIWYLLLKIMDNHKSLIYSILFCVFLSIMTFIHLYYFLLAFFFVSFFILIHFLQHKKKSYFQIYLSLALATLFPMLVFQIWFQSSLQDANDVVTYPYGFFEYVSYPQSVFLPSLGQGANFLAEHLHIKPRNAEGFAYIGLVAGLIALYFVLKLLRFRQFRRYWKPALPNHLSTIMWVAFCMLLLSFGFPKFMGDYLGALRNFRSLGRLAWVFYYVHSVFAAYFLYKFSRYLSIYSAKFPKLGYYFLLAIALAFWGMESFFNAQQTYLNLRNAKISEVFYVWKEDIRPDLQKQGLQATDFQAILALPFFHNGSEKFLLIDNTWEAQICGYAIARKTGLPLLDNYSARAPLSTSIRSIQWVADPVINKQVIKDLPNQKPLLLLISKVGSQGGMERFYAEHATFLFEKEAFRVYRLDIANLLATQKQVVEAVSKYKNSPVVVNEHFHLSKPSQNVHIQSFGDDWWAEDSAEKFVKRSEQRKEILYELPYQAENENSQKMELSFWVKVDIHSHYLPAFQVNLLDEKGQLLKEEIFTAKGSSNVIGNWVRANLWLDVPTNCKKITIQNLDSENLSMDNLLFRPIEVEIYYEKEKVRVYNNFKLP